MTAEPPANDDIDAERQRAATAAKNWVAVALLFGAAIFTTYLAYNQGLATLVAPKDASTEDYQGAAASIAGILLAGAVTFFLAVGGIVTLFHALQLTSGDRPLGLPEGTVHALIALTLIFLFFVMAVFLYIDVSRTTTERWLYDQTAGQIAGRADILLPVERQVPIADATPRPDGTQPTEARYEMLIAAPRASSEVAEDIARQLVTSLGTLIAAIAAFYFGARPLGGNR